MQLDMLLTCVARMLMRMNGVAMCDMRMVSRGFVVAFADMLRGSAVMFGGLFVVLGCLLVKFLQLFHDRSSVCG